VALVQRFILATAMVLGAACINIPPLVDCTARTDCARDEVCQDGRCMAGTSVFREPAGNLLPPMDAGFADANQTVDTGMVGDAGFACLNVTIEGRSETFCTIADAIMSAVAGDKVVLPAQDIFESISLVDKQLTISGSTQGTQKTRIIAPNGEIGIVSAASGAIFEHLEVRSDNAEGLRIAESATLRLVKVTAARGAGMTITGRATVRIENPTINGVVSDSSNVEGGAGSGLNLTEGVTVVLTFGTISGCMGSGIYVDGGSLTMTDTILSQNNRGLEAVNPGATQPILHLNGANALENKRSGFHISDSQGTIQDCVVRRNGTAQITSDAHGIFLGLGTMVSVQGISAQMNVSHGMFCEGDVIPTTCQDNAYGSNNVSTNCPGC
jgi:hypothetical protein